MKTSPWRNQRLHLTEFNNCTTPVPQKDLQHMHHFCLFYTTRTNATICHNKVTFFQWFFSFLDGTENVSFIVYDCGADQWRTKNYYEIIFVTVYSYILYKHKIWVGRHRIKSLEKPTISSRKKNHNN